MSDLGGKGLNAGMTAVRHRALNAPPQRASRRTKLECLGCASTVTGVAVVAQGRVYCSWDCAVSAAGMIPGQYFG